MNALGKRIVVGVASLGDAFVLTARLQGLFQRAQAMKEYSADEYSSP